ncbi:hypothetical protein AB0E08_07625 [Streptomyces sp. NPDC048281]|uniref:hypothetical protein n=1 Tax=Streptomyces sp. NPDC048281 TaxID=3154715 RepID=UPI00342265F1
MPRSITSKLTSAERQALLHADPASGRINASSYDLRADLADKGYAEYRNRYLFLTEYGRRLHDRLREEHKEFAVAGVPWTKITQITDLYLYTGLTVEEISQRTRVTAKSVTKVLTFRQVMTTT